MAKSQKVRLNLELTPVAKQRLEELQRRTDSTSISEVVRRSIALYDLMLDRYTVQGQVKLRSNTGEEETLALL